MAIALLTERDIERYGNNLSRCYRIETSAEFDNLLHMIDKADAALIARSRDRTS
ncbi:MULTISPECIES: hypothetical protein [Sphingomonas]|uniref:Uncharacterized protein n=1 Tax=Sphingomonas trueperi TaxID=53317 RepID=A0A7X5Y0Y8_9SPHN|nr:MULTISPECIES: hypothetical protein [Sphingomonas]NJB97775.1 hypothetical protein [Sphingomonas trueperi]